MTLLFESWRLLAQRGVLHQPSATLVLADIHLGYSDARRRAGDALPFQTIIDDLQPLTEVVRAHKVRGLIVAGDLFEAGFEPDTYQKFAAVLADLKVTFLGLVPGNHDRGVDKAGAQVPLFPDGYELDGWRIVHGDQPINSERTIAGHWHPAIRWKHWKLPCFLVQGTQMILPAFSRDAAGVDTKSDARWRGWDYYAIDGNEVVRIIK